MLCSGFRRNLAILFVLFKRFFVYPHSPKGIWLHLSCGNLEAVVLYIHVFGSSHIASFLRLLCQGAMPGAKKSRAPIFGLQRLSNILAFAFSFGIDGLYVSHFPSFQHFSGFS